MVKVGFIGLGNMGKPMAVNLLKAGIQPAVYDIMSSPMEELASLGAKPVKSPSEVAADSEVIITMLPNTQHVEEVILGQNGVLAGAGEGSLIVDMSSIAPIPTQKIAEKAAKKGIGFLDAPVTGGTVGAVNGTLTIMVGGEEKDLDKAKPILEKMGRKIIHVGRVGMGQTAKICNQIVVGLSFCAASEAFVLGVKAGADPIKLHEILNSGSAHSWALNAKMPGVFEGNFDGGFMIDLQHKDLGIALETGRDLHVPLCFAGLAYQAYEAARAQGLGKKDHSAVIQVLEKLVNVEVRKKKEA